VTADRLQDFKMNENDLTHAFAREHVNLASGLLSLMMPQTSGAGIGLKGLDGRYQLANQIMESLVGRRLGEVTGKTDDDLFPPEVAAQLQRTDQDITNGAATASNELDFSCNGASLRCLWLKFPVAGPDGKILLIGAVMLPVPGQEAVEGMLQSLDRLQQTNQELQKTLASIDRLARTDKLTGAWNRRRLEEAVVNEMDRLRRFDHPLSLLVIHIDGFKDVNADHGHAAGDQLLAELATVLQANLRATDALARWSDEQFVVLCPNTTQSTAAVLAERLRAKVAATVFAPVKTATVSLGVAECSTGETWDQWFNRTDSALFRARVSGRNQVQRAPEAPQRAGIGENVAANFVQLSWHTAYDSGNAVIDDQHKTLFDDANRLLAAILSSRPHDEVATLIDALINHVVQHFQDEEAIINATGFPGAQGHAAIHRTLVDKAAEVANRFHGGTLGVGEVFQFLAHDVVARHMLGADREFFPFLKAAGAEAISVPE
jgi:diguanylate cyclase (GGDEF)-like protein/hemerythrin-like metal-binding protein